MSGFSVGAPLSPAVAQHSDQTLCPLARCEVVLLVGLGPCGPVAWRPYPSLRREKGRLNEEDAPDVRTSVASVVNAVPNAAHPPTHLPEALASISDAECLPGQPVGKP